MSPEEGADDKIQYKMQVQQWLQMKKPKEILHSVKRDIFARLQVHPRVDVFGDDKVNFVEAWKGEQLRYETWKDKGILFMNPPIAGLAKLAGVIGTHKLKTVIVLPSWGETEYSKGWYHKMWSMAVRYYKYKKGFRFWQGTEQPEWGMTALLLDGSKNLAKNAVSEDGDVLAVDMDHQESSSSRRRKRRKLAKTATKRR
jgi:hypothetical protein